MSLLTSWGYELVDAESLPELITETEFNTICVHNKNCFKKLINKIICLSVTYSTIISASTTSLSLIGTLFINFNSVVSIQPRSKSEAISLAAIVKAL